MRMIPLVFIVIAGFAVSGCTAVGAAAGTAAGAVADVAVSVISTTADVAGGVIGGAARTVSGSSKSEHEAR